MFTENEKIRINEVKETIKFHTKALMNFDWWKLLYENDAIYLSGGAIGSLLRGEIPKDWDFYFYDIDTAVSFKDYIVKNYDDEIKEVNDNYMEHADNNGKMITANAITMKTDDSFIFTFAGHPNDVRNHFDFVHCKPYYLLMQDKLFISREQYDACVNKKLIYNTDIKFIKEWRTQKFMKKGFKFDDQSAY